MGTASSGRSLTAMNRQFQTNPSELRESLARLLAGHRRGVVRLAKVLGARAGVHPNGLMFVLAARQSNIASVIRELFPSVALSKEGVIVPGLASELPKWTERLEVSGPVWNCSVSPEGIPVVLIDDSNDMALCRLPHETRS